jgi:hypothetical protein
MDYLDTPNGTFVPSKIIVDAYTGVFMGEST